MSTTATERVAAASFEAALGEDRDPGSHRTRRLNALAIRGTFWTLGSYATSQALRLGGNIVLSRLLVPQYFGFMTLLNSMMMGLALFSDFGVNGSVTRDPRGDEPEFLNTAWTIQVIRGFLLWTVCLVLARPAAAFYHEPALVGILPALGFTTVLTGFSSIKLYSLIRRLAVREFAFFEIFTQMVQILVAVTWALIHPSVWALVGGGLVSCLARAIASHLLLPGPRDRFAWERRSLESIFAFGKWVFVSGIVFYLASQSDRLVIGRLTSFQTLALYGMAFSLADIPRQVILALAAKIVYPFIAKFAHFPRHEYRAAMLRYRKNMLLLAGLGIAVVINTADLAFVHIYDRRYWPAAWMIPVLATGLWHTVLYTTSSQSLVALGKSAYNFVGYSLSAAVLYAGLPFVFHRYGMFATVVVVAFSDVPMYLVNLCGLWREKLQVVRQDVWATALFVAMCGSGALVRISLGVNFPKVV